MPELPEVETVRRGLEPVMEGARFVEVDARRRDLRWPLPKDFAARLKGQTVTGLGRRAKYLLADLSSGEVLVIHLGMSGSFRVLRTDGKHGGSERAAPCGGSLEARTQHDRRAGAKRAERADESGNRCGGGTDDGEIRGLRELRRCRPGAQPRHHGMTQVDRPHRATKSAAQYVRHHRGTDASRPVGGTDHGERLRSQQVLEVVTAHVCVESCIGACLPSAATLRVTGAATYAYTYYSEWCFPLPSLTYKRTCSEPQATRGEHVCQAERSARSPIL